MRKVLSVIMVLLLAVIVASDIAERVIQRSYTALSTEVAVNQATENDSYLLLQVEQEKREVLVELITYGQYVLGAIIIVIASYLIFTGVKHKEKKDEKI